MATQASFHNYTPEEIIMTSPLSLTQYNDTRNLDLRNGIDQQVSISPIEVTPDQIGVEVNQKFPDTYIVSIFLQGQKDGTLIEAIYGLQMYCMHRYSAIFHTELPVAQAIEDPTKDYLLVCYFTKRSVADTIRSSMESANKAILSLWIQGCRVGKDRTGKESLYMRIQLSAIPQRRTPLTALNFLRATNAMPQESKTAMVVEPEKKSLLAMIIEQRDRSKPSR